MNHDFTVEKGFSDITIMYCKKCGKSYSLVRYSGTMIVSSRTAWEEMTFENSKSEPADSPKSCEEQV